jgi:hypothetical protein
MPDYTRHLMQNWGWYSEYRSRMGREALDKYVSSVYRMIASMAPDTYFSIEKNVKPENTDLFIKVCCMFIQEESMSRRARNFCHGFNTGCSEIRCTALHYPKKNSNKSNSVTV